VPELQSTSCFLQGKSPQVANSECVNMSAVQSTINSPYRNETPVISTSGVPGIVFSSASRTVRVLGINL